MTAVGGFHRVGIVVAAIAAGCGAGRTEALDFVAAADIAEVDGKEMQGRELEGHWLPRPHTRVGVFYTGATLAGAALTDLKIPERSARLVGTVGRTSKQGVALEGAVLMGHLEDGSAARLRIGAVRSARADEDAIGVTDLYEVRRWDGSGWTPLCRPDADGQTWAVPYKGVWNDTGHHIPTDNEFTLACTAGVIAKCGQFGWRPWTVIIQLLGVPYEVRPELHQACTRAARFDVCGDGQSRTMNGTEVNIFDNALLPAKKDDVDGRIWLFEAGYDEHGAKCLHHLRWEHLGLENGCPGRRGPFEYPTTAGGRVTVRQCKSLAEINMLYPDVRLFVESFTHKL